MKFGMKAALLAMALCAPSAANAQETLTIWWAKGFYQAEDTALFDVIKKFEDKTGVKVDLSQYSVQDLVPKTVAALDAGTPPDVAYADVFDAQVAGKWAFEGKLEDLSDILVPIKDRFAPMTLETTFLYNDQTKARAYYAFPLKQNVFHIEIWKDRLAQAGFTEADIPKDWKAYWNFWCDTVQPALRKATGERDYVVGLPMGVESNDSASTFNTFMDAYSISLVDADGKVDIDDADRQGLIGAVTDYTELYNKGCMPPSVTSWKDPDNNAAFANRSILMTMNGTISIATKWLDDSNNASLTEEERAQAKKNYEENIITGEFPNAVDGSPMAYRSGVKTGLVFKDSKNKARAREFVEFLLQEENLTPYVEGALGRWFPVTPVADDSPFWTADKHRQAVLTQYATGNTLPYAYTQNYKFTILVNENVFAQALNAVVIDKLPVEQAVDNMIARIKEVAG